MVAPLITPSVHRPLGSTGWRRVVVGVVIAAAGALGWAQTTPAGPDETLGPLFADVQRARCFPDQKTFADAVPRTSVSRILAEYEAAVRTGRGEFDACAFARAHFLLPEGHELTIEPATSLTQHLHHLWERLRRAPDQTIPGSSLLPLPHPYIVPGGRFREVYYWDSYFTMLGLRESGEIQLIESMVDNFAHLIGTFGHIPNGNRTYYLTRSQPPFFALMVELLAELRGASVYARYLPALQQEYAYWNDETAPTRHRVRLPDGQVLHRYYDVGERPRPEAWMHDEEVAQRAQRPAAEVYRQLRSACESGWDFSSRWLAGSGDLARIEILDLIPVDLNCLLYSLEQTLERAYQAVGDQPRAAELRRAAAARREAILRYCWSAEDGFFVDYHVRTQQRSRERTLAGVFPLFVGLADAPQAEAVRQVIAELFLKPGGVVTTLRQTGQQWDAPNGWAPLQWTTVRGLERYGHSTLAQEIARRWLDLNAAVFRRTGKMMEKYDVVNLQLEAGGGEYPGQDGFGWTNGVFLALQRSYGAPTETSAAISSGH